MLYIDKWQFKRTESLLDLDSVASSSPAHTPLHVYPCNQIKMEIQTVFRSLWLQKQFKSINEDIDSGSIPFSDCLPCRNVADSAIKMHLCYHEWNEFLERGPEILSLKTWGCFKCQNHSGNPFSRLNTPIWDALFAETFGLTDSERPHSMCSVNEISNSFSAICYHVIQKKCRVCFFLMEHFQPTFSSYYRAVREGYLLWKIILFLSCYLSVSWNTLQKLGKLDEDGRIPISVTDLKRFLLF